MGEVRLITMSEYARHRGVTPAAVTKAIANNRITTVERDGKVWIDPEVADIQWARNTRDFGQQRKAPAPAAVATPIEAELYDMQQARAKREHHEANLAALREAEKLGALVAFDDVKRAAAAASAQMAQIIDRLPVRLGDVLAAETDPVRVRQLLEEALAEALGEFADACEAMADAGQP